MNREMDVGLTQRLFLALEGGMGLTACKQSGAPGWLVRVGLMQGICLLLTGSLEACWVAEQKIFTIKDVMTVACQISIITHSSNHIHSK